jgi:hypothetical protein
MNETPDDLVDDELTQLFRRTQPPQGAVDAQKLLAHPSAVMANDSLTPVPDKRW